MKNFDFAAFESELLAATRAAFLAAKASDVYAVGLRANALFAWFEPIAHTESQLLRAAKTAGIYDESQAQRMRWEPDAWAPLKKTPAFRTLSRRLRDVPDACAAMTERAFNAFWERMMGGVEHALVRLRREKLFGSTEPTFLFVFDEPSEEEMLQNSKPLNGARSWKRLSAEMAEAKKSVRQRATHESPAVPAATSKTPKARKPSGDLYAMATEYGPKGNSVWRGVTLTLKDEKRVREPKSFGRATVNGRVGTGKATPDIFNSYPAPVINQRALDVLAPFFGTEVEAVPLEGKKLFVLHLLKPETPCGNNPGRSGDCVFKRSDIRGRHFVKAYVHWFVSEPVRDAIEAAALTGVRLHRPKYSVTGLR